MNTSVFHYDATERTLVTITYDKRLVVRKYNVREASLSRLLTTLNSGGFQIFGTTTGFVAHRKEG